MLDERTNRIKLAIMLAFLIVTFFLSFAVGRYPVALADIFKVLANKLGQANFDLDPSVYNVMFRVRLPRILAGLLIGAALASSGAIFQAIFRNPMASPDLLGASSGASFGAALGILLYLSYFKVSFLSFAFGLLAVGLTYFISSLSRLEQSLSLVLAGIMVSSIFSSLLSIVKLLADPTDSLPSITYWLMGSLSNVSMDDLALASPLILIGLGLALALSWRLNLLTMGEEEAASMGVNIRALRGIMIAAASLLTATSVSISGNIGWVGLVIPHFARLVIGNDYKYVIPASMLMGSTYLLLIDNISRTATTIEIPLGILTALVGAPFFIYLLIRGSDR